MPEENEYIEDMYEHIAKGGLVNFLSQVSYSVMALLTSILVARLLGPEEYGIFSILSSLQSLAILLASLNISVAVTKYLSEYRVTDFEKSVRYLNTTGILTICSSVIVWIICLVLADYLAMLYNYTISPFLINIAIAPVLISPLILFFYSAFRGYQKIKQHAYLQIITSLTRSTILITFTFLFGLIGLLIGIILEAALFLVIQVISLKQNVPHLFSFRPSLKAIRKDEVLSIFRFVIPTFIPLIAITFTDWLTRTLLALNRGYTEIAFFAVAFTLSQVVTYVPRALSIPLLPSISEISTLSTEKVNVITNKTVTFVTYLGFLIALLMSIFPVYIIWILYGNLYANTTTYLILIVGSVSFFLHATLSPLVDVLLAIGKTRIYCFIFLVKVFFLFILSIFLIPAAGGIGLSIGYLLSTVLFAILIRIYFSRLNQEIVYFPMIMTILLISLSIIVFWAFLSFGIFYSSILAVIIFLSAFILIILKLKEMGVFSLISSFIFQK